MIIRKDERQPTKKKKKKYTHTHTTKTHKVTSYIMTDNCAGER